MCIVYTVSTSMVYKILYSSPWRPLAHFHIFSPTRHTIIVAYIFLNVINKVPDSGTLGITGKSDKHRRNLVDNIEVRAYKSSTTWTHTSDTTFRMCRLTSHWTLHWKLYSPYLICNRNLRGHSPKTFDQKMSSFTRTFSMSFPDEALL